MSASQQDLCLIPPNEIETDLSRESRHPQLHVTLPVPAPSFSMENSSSYSRQVDSNQPYFGKDNPDHNPFFHGNLNDNYVNSDYFTRRYNPDKFLQKEDQDINAGQQANKDGGKNYIFSF